MKLLMGKQFLCVLLVIFRQGKHRPDRILAKRMRLADALLYMLRQPAADQHRQVLLVQQAVHLQCRFFALCIPQKGIGGNRSLCIQHLFPSGKLSCGIGIKTDRGKQADVIQLALLKVLRAPQSTAAHFLP